MTVRSTFDTFGDSPCAHMIDGKIRCNMPRKHPWHEVPANEPRRGRHEYNPGEQQTKATKADIVERIRLRQDSPSRLADEAVGEIERLRDGINKLWAVWCGCSTHSANDRRCMEGAFKNVL